MCVCDSVCVFISIAYVRLLINVLVYVYNSYGGGGGGHSHISVLPISFHPPPEWTLNGVSHHVTLCTLNGVTPTKHNPKWRMNCYGADYDTLNGARFLRPSQLANSERERVRAVCRKRGAASDTLYTLRKKGSLAVPQVEPVKVL